jgi:hypothetical protein
MSDERLERELKALAKEVRLPNKVREGVERKARQMDNAAIVPAGTGRSVTRRNLLWGSVVSAGVAASLLGLAILGRNQQNDQDSLTKGPGDSFVLRAYAEGMPQEDGSVLTTRFISTLGSAGTTDTGWYASRDIDLTCMGDGITSIEYSLSGSNVSRVAGQEATEQAIVRFDALYNGETGENEPLPEDNGTATSYVVAYDGQAADEQAFNRTLYAEFPTDDALDAAEALSQQLSEVGHSGASTWEDAVQQAEANIALDRLLEKRSADLLASTTLTMTAHLQDGGAQSHAYSISLREGFDHILDEWLDSQVEPTATINCYRDDPDHADDYAAAQERIQYIYSQPPDLFVLTELEQK